MHDDVDRLVEALNETAAAPSSAPPRRVASRLEAWLRTLVARGGSDLFLVAGAPPAIRVDGAVHPLGEALLDGQDIEDAVLPALSGCGGQIGARSSNIAKSPNPPPTATSLPPTVPPATLQPSSTSAPPTPVPPSADSPACGT